MDCTAVYMPMGHGLYSDMYAHDPWTVQQYMCPWVMGRTAVCGPHESWTVQQYVWSMGHGLYNGIPIPWVMDRTVVYLVHGPWVVQ